MSKKIGRSTFFYVKGKDLIDKTYLGFCIQATDLFSTNEDLILGVSFKARYFLNHYPTKLENEVYEEFILTSLEQRLGILHRFRSKAVSQSEVYDIAREWMNGIIDIIDTYNRTAKTPLHEELEKLLKNT